VALAAASLFGQTAAEQLQRAIFTQDAQGNKDEAINLFRQLAYATTTPVDVAAQAQYRLAQALLQKGDLSAATREMERLEKSFPDQSALIAKLASGGARAGSPLTVVETARATAAQEAAEFDSSRSVTVRGPITSVAWSNPVAWVMLTDSKDWRMRLTSPNSMVQSGMTRLTLKHGDTVTVVAAPARDGSATGLAMSITASDGKVLFDRLKIPAPTSVVVPNPDATELLRQVIERTAARKAAESQQHH
jgi:hypothetical protein